MKELGNPYEDMLYSVWAPHNGVRSGEDALNSRRAAVRMIPTVTGFDVASSDVRSPGYWRSNLESQVQFETAVMTVLLDGSRHPVEIGPHFTLQLPIQETAHSLGLSPDNYVYQSPLVPNRDSVDSIL